MTIFPFLKSFISSSTSSIRPQEELFNLIDTFGGVDLTIPRVSEGFLLSDVAGKSGVYSGIVPSPFEFINSRFAFLLSANTFPK